MVYDNIQFTKKSWIRRNRILLNGKVKQFTLPIKKDSDYLDVKERYLSDCFSEAQQKLLSQIKQGYRRARYFEEVYPLIEECLTYESKNLFEFIYHSIIKIAYFLDLDTEIIISSNIDMNNSLQNRDRVIETCKVLGGDIYINPIGGIELYKKDDFLLNDIQLKFIQSFHTEYKQFDNEFIPNLSIIDVMMFNSRESIKEMLHEIKLI